MKNIIYNELKKKIILQKEINYIFLCIGTEKIVGDSYGPLVGEKLYNNLNKNKNVHVIGKLKENVTYTMVKNEIKKIEKNYIKPYIIAIDAATSTQKNIGKIIVTERKIKVGEGVKKDGYSVGNISIKAIVGKKENNILKSYKELQNVPYSTVEKLVDETVKGILMLKV